MEGVSGVFIGCLIFSGLCNRRNIIGSSTHWYRGFCLFIAYLNDYSFFINDCNDFLSSNYFSFPSGGGAYLVAKEHLNTNYALIAGAALMIDYILTVAVSITSGVAALTSAFPFLIPLRVEISIVMILILMVLNLRGIRESGTIFAYPTYLFIGSVIFMLIGGSFQLWHEGWHGYSQSAPVQHGNSLIGSGAILLLYLRAFASGCSAMTGVEAISNGVPAFRSPSTKNAAITMIWMSTVLAVMFFGISFLAYGFGVIPQEHETVVSQIVEHIFGRGIIYYFIQIVTMLILFLAANTSFAGFPQLTSIIARDGFLPRNLTARGTALYFQMESSYSVLWRLF